MSLIKRDNFPFGSVFSDIFADDGFFTSSRLPAVNVKEEKDTFEVELAAPGMKKDDFNIEVHNNVITISSEKKEEKKEEKDKYTRREFSYSSFKRSFSLPDSIDDSRIDAKYTDGVLKVTLPKKEESKKESPKKIKIN